jgi:hypothetical protein
MDTVNKTDSVIMASYRDEHWYKITKKEQDFYIASVTTKLSVERIHAIEKWRGEIGNREADLKMYESQNRGKRIHHAMEIFLKGGVVLYNSWERPTYSEEDIKAMNADANGMVIVLHEQDEMLDVWKLQQFFDIVKPKILYSEKIVYSIEKDIAGTLDIAMEIEAGSYPVNGTKPLIIPKTGTYIADLKTGKVVEDKVWRQLAPYCYAFEEMGIGKPLGALVLHTQGITRSGIPGLSVKFASKEELPAYLDDYFHLAAIWKRNNENAGPKIFSFPTKIQRKTK